MNSDYIDIYCERLLPGLWAEPLNAITNVAFFIAAFFTLRLGPQDFGVRILTLLMLCIGVGSSLFHTVASPATQMADVMPIVMFQVAFIWFYSLQVMKLGAVKTSCLFVLFLAASVLADRIPSSVMNGSLSYGPALLFITGFGVWHYKNAAAEKFVVLMAAGVFVISLMFRSLDMAVCAGLPIGTHFIWHCLNGVVLYCSARGFVRAKKLI